MPVMGFLLNAIATSVFEFFPVSDLPVRHVNTCLLDFTLFWKVFQDGGIDPLKPNYLRLMRKRADGCLGILKIKHLGIAVIGRIHPLQRRISVQIISRLLAENEALRQQVK